ncbi:MAG: TrkA family potassium uptake protein [Candidatus Onthovivens sp.]|nr:TrkA family potassium uptake protein [Candidatus Onthovivens sp.]
MAKKKKTIGIIGLGKFGMCLAQELVESGKSIVCIDKDEKKIKKVLEICDYAFVNEDLSKKTLEETGFKECDVIVVCIAEHMDTAILATINALSLESGKVMALSNTEEQGIILEKLGAEVIYPYRDSADRLVKKIVSNNLVDFIALNDEVEICETKVPKKYIGEALKDTDIRGKFGINIIAIETNGKINTRFAPSYVLTKDDTLVVLGEKKMLRKFEDKN